MSGVRLAIENELESIGPTAMSVGLHTVFGTGTSELDQLGATIPVDTRTFRVLPNVGARASLWRFSGRLAVGAGVSSESEIATLGEWSERRSRTSVTLALLSDVDIRIAGPVALGGEVMVPLDMALDGDGEIQLSAATFGVFLRLVF